MEHENGNKNMTIVLTIIGIATLLAAVVGATFAFYSITQTGDVTSTNVTGQTEGLGGTTLSNPTQDLHINLSTIDMNKANEGKTYYSTKNSTENYKETEEYEIITKAEVSGGDVGSKYLCNSNLKIEVDDTSTMKDAIVAGDGKVKIKPSDNVTIGTLEYDLKTLIDATNGITLPVVYKITKATEDNAQESISAVMSINNTTSDQIGLAGKTLKVKLSVSEFGCNPVDSFE